MRDNLTSKALSARVLQSTALSETPSEISPYPIDRWLAASLLQKAIRRGESETARRAGLALLRQNDVAFWRRLLVTSWEDVAFGDLECCFAVTAASQSRRIRLELGEEALALALITRLTRAAKNRIADDIITVVENDPAEFAAAQRIGNLDVPYLRQIAFPSDRCIMKRTVAAWLLIGTTTIPSGFLPRVKGSSSTFFSAFPDEQVSLDLRFFAEAGLRRSRTLLPAIIAMLEDQFRLAKEPEAEVHDALLATDLVGQIPEYAFDGHTRAGCGYLRKVSHADVRLCVWLHQHGADDLRLPMLKKLFFRSVSSQCDRRQAWGSVERTRQRADGVGFRLDPPIFQEGLLIFREALDSYPVRELVS